MSHSVLIFPPPSFNLSYISLSGITLLIEALGLTPRLPVKLKTIPLNRGREFWNVFPTLDYREEPLSCL